MTARIERFAGQLGTVLALVLVVLLTGGNAHAQTCTVKDNSDNPADTGSLRYCVNNASFGETINFAGSLNGETITVTPANGPLSIRKGLTIQGPGANLLTISGNNAVQAVLSIPFQTLGPVIISGLTIANASSAGDGGGIENVEPSHLEVSDCIFYGNHAGFGGGAIYDGSSSFLTVSNSTFYGNSASYGGAIYSNAGILIRDSTFFDNTATWGGAIYNGDATTVINSTFSGNSAEQGGGIFASGSSVTLVNSTLSGNSAQHGGAIFDNSGLLTLKSTIVANSSSGNNCHNNVSGTSDGYNLSDDSSCTFLNSLSDRNNIPAGLDANGLQDNGGLTKTIALVSTSPAIGAIPLANCTDTNGVPITTDQRGVTRPDDSEGFCDIGAYEFVDPILFSSFLAKLDIRADSPPGFDLNSTFTLGASSKGINPLTEAVTLQVGAYSVRIPANSFHQLRNGAKAGCYVFSGTIDGVSVSAEIVPRGGNSYQFKIEGSPVNLTGQPDPVSVTLTIGNDAGRTSADADQRQI